MRIFLAGASGVVGTQLVPLLVAEGHVVVGMTRSQDKAERLRALGADPVVCDVFDTEALNGAVHAARPDLVMHQLTDLPDDVKRIAFYARRNNRIRTEGTRNLIESMRAARVERLLAQSIAWTPPFAGRAVAEHERLVLEAGGVVVRYGQFYGPGTYGGDQAPSPPRIHVKEAARRTMALLGAQTGVVVLTEDPRAGKESP